MTKEVEILSIYYIYVYMYMNIYHRIYIFTTEYMNTLCMSYLTYICVLWQNVQIFIYQILLFIEMLIILLISSEVFFVYSK